MNLAAIRTKGVPRETDLNISTVTKLPYITTGKFGICRGWTMHKPCGRPANYHYRAGSTKKAHAMSGSWCWYHLFMEGIWYRLYDYQRAERAYKKIQSNKE